MQMTLKEYLEQCALHGDRDAGIPEYLFTCGQLIDLLKERDELREQLEIVSKAKPMNTKADIRDVGNIADALDSITNEEAEIKEWLNEKDAECWQKNQYAKGVIYTSTTLPDVRTYISGGEVMERPV